MELSTWLIILMLIVLIFTGTIKIKNTNLKENILEGFTEKSNHDKIAFCFLTIGDNHKSDIWQKFLKGKEHLYNIYVHPKYPDKIKSFLKYNIIPSDDHVQTKWGDISLVKATLKLFKNAIADPTNKMFVLVSDSCIPIYNFDYIYNDIMSSQNNMIPFHSQQNKYTLLRYNKLKDKDFLPKYKFKKVSQWLILNQQTTQFVVANDHTIQYKNMFSPDEHYFANILDKYNKEYTKRKINFDNWDEPSLEARFTPYPKTYTEINSNDIKKIRSSGALFLRKIVPETKINTEDLFDKLDSNIAIISR